MEYKHKVNIVKAENIETGGLELSIDTSQLMKDDFVDYEENVHDDSKICGSQGSWQGHPPLQQHEGSYQGQGQSTSANVTGRFVVLNDFFSSRDECPGS